MGLRSLFRSDKGRREQELQEREEQLALANRLSQIIASSANLSDLCKSFADEIKDLMSIDWGAIALIEGSTATVRLSPLSSAISSTWKSGDTMPLLGSPVAWVAENQQAMVEPDLKRKSQFPTGTAFIKQKIRSAVYMPLFSRREVFGSLIVGSHEPDAYGERELKLLKYATTQLAMAIEGFRTSVEVQWQVDFIAALKHELKTPLTPVISGSDLLAAELEKEPTSPEARLAESISHGARSLDSKLTELLELARIEGPDFKLKLVKLDISSVVEDAVARFASYLERKGQSLDLNLLRSLPMVKADKEYLTQALLTLLAVASGFSPEGGKIELRASGNKDEVVVAVQDSGSGFSKKDQKEMMLPYTFADAARQRFPGERLKLTIVRHLVQRHGGRLWLESKSGQGSTFSFSLPIDKD